MIKNTNPKSDIKIIIDTREQRPYNFDNSVSQKLQTGDYSAVGFEQLVIVERKSKADLIGTITRHRARFKRELKRMEPAPFACVVVECSLLDILNDDYQGGIPPRAVLGSIMSIIIDYGVPVFFCGDRAGAKEFTKKYICKAIRHLENNR